MNHSITLALGLLSIPIYAAAGATQPAHVIHSLHESQGDIKIVKLDVDYFAMPNNAALYSAAVRLNVFHHSGSGADWDIEGAKSALKPLAKSRAFVLPAGDWSIIPGTLTFFKKISQRVFTEPTTTTCLHVSPKGAMRSARFTSFSDAIAWDELGDLGNEIKLTEAGKLVDPVAAIQTLNRFFDQQKEP